MTADSISEQLGAAYDRFGQKARSLHLEMLRSLGRPKDLAFHTETGEDNRSIVTVCTSDCIGALSTIAGLFAAYRVDILSADVFTLRFRSPRRTGRAATKGQPRPRSRLRATRSTRKLLDIFEVRATPHTPPDTWQGFRDDLAGLIALLMQGDQETAQDQIIDRVSEAVRAAGDVSTPLYPMAIGLSNDAAPDLTQLTIRSTDTPGFLFAFTNALTFLSANIEHAEIRTVGSEIHDTFWLTDARGRKIVAQERINELRGAAALIKHFTHLLPRSPNPAQALRQFNALTRQMLSRPDWTGELRDLESTPVLETLAQLMGVSRFLWDDFLRMQHENLFPVLLDLPALDEPRPLGRLRRSLRRRTRSPAEHGDRALELNSFKDREMFRIDLRHITGRVGFGEFSEELSDLAAVVVEEAAELSYRSLSQRFGPPTLGGGRRCPWSVCALGKFGAREMGFGSDVELIFVYQDEGATDGPDPIENSRFFGDLVQLFLKTLTARREGIFEIDLRLRPHGKSGPLASTLGRFAEYYSTRGAARQFERMALVKLRPVAGDAGLGERILDSRDAFVYSGAPLDVENIRHLRRRQASELVKTGAVNAKYSPGGLVEVEYFVQACQIAAGHLDIGVRVRSTLDAVERLQKGGHLRLESAHELRETYGFLRRLIDALRAVRGHAKDLTLPDTGSREFAYLARRLRYDTSEQLAGAIAARMGHARSLWDDGLPAAR